ncbi:MAG: 2-C-methyl-D-erythritol 4-phosphate cytidylyltransferase [Verrucomicrobiota bacterium]|jgi:2-C-methyl-D-erythritol 4-phosphate cytidylyltransferase
MLTAIIVAAGSSRRMGFDKLSASIAGKTVIAHTVDAFAASASVREIIVVVHKDRRKEFETILGRAEKVREIVVGGEHRQDSVQAGLQRLDDLADYVAVHDGARPLVRAEEIDRVYEHARVHGAAALAEPVSDTLKRADDNLSVIESLDRNHVYAMQTPQIFERRMLEQAYREILQTGRRITDEVSAIEYLGRPVVLVPGNDFNFKITYERDLRLAESILQARAAHR